MPEGDLVESFRRFYIRFFPEYGRMTRAQTFERIGELRDGQTSTLPDRETIEYQNRVAGVYGAYEAIEFQIATMGHILSQLTFPKETLVSLGSGPGTYELWLLSQDKVGQVTLVDYSPAMLERARSIAQALGLEERVTFRCDDITRNPLPPHSADAVFSINAMHWTKRWSRWVFEAARIARFGGEAFLSCTLEAPRSGITAQLLAKEVHKYFDVTNANLITPPQMVGGGMAALNLRTFVACRRRGRLG